MTGNIDNIIGPAHNIKIAFIIKVAGIAGFVIARKFNKIFIIKSLVIAP